MLNVLLISKDTEDLHHLEKDLTRGEDAYLTIQYLSDLALVDQYFRNDEVSAILVKPGAEGFVSLELIHEWSESVATIILCEQVDPSRIGEILGSGALDIWIENEGRYPAALERLKRAIHLHRQQRGLRTSSALLKMIGDHLHDVLWLFDLNTMTVESVSGSVQRILGYTSEEATKLSLQELFTPNSYQFAVDMLAIDQNRIQSGEWMSPGLDEMEVVAKDRKIIPMEFSTSYLVGPAGSIKLVGVARSLAERREFQLQMQQQEKNYRFLYETITQGVVYQDADGRVIDANPAASRILRLNRQKLVTNQSEFMLWQMVDEGGNALGAEDHPFVIAKTTAKPVENEVLGLTHPHFPGTIWLRLHAVPILDKKSGAVQMVYTLFEDITEILQAQRELQRSEERFRQVVESIDEGFWIYDNRKQRMDYLSPAFEEIWGMDAAEYLGENQTGRSMVHPDDLETWEAAAASVSLNEGKETSTEYRIVRPDGGIRWVHDDTYPVLDENQQVIRTVGVVKDITEMHETQQQLQESENRFRQVVETIDDLFWIYDNLTEEITYLSPAFESIWGVPPEAYLKDVELGARMVHPDDMEVWQESYDQQHQGLETSHEYRITRPDGEVRWLHDDSYPIFDEHHRLVRTIGVVKDISEIYSAQQAMRNSEERLRQVVETIDEGFWIYDNLADEMEYLSPSFSNIWGVAPEEYLADTNLQFVHPDDQARWNEAVRQQRAGLETTLEYRIHRPDGTLRWVRSDSYPVFDEDQRLVRTVGVVKDITEQHRMIEALRASETLFRDMFYQHSAVKMLVDPEDGSVIDVNRAAEQFYGWTREEFQQMKVSDFVLRPDGEIQDKIGETIDGERQYYEHRHRLKDGSEREMAIFAASVDYHGRSVILSILHDITDEKRALQELHDSAETFRDMFYQHPAVKMLIDPADGRIVDVNQAAIEFYGWDAVAFKQKTIHEINTLSHEEVQAEMRRAKEHRRIYFEFKHRRADGSIRDVAVFSGSVNYHGRILLHSIIHDITDQNQAEADLLASLQRFQALAEISLVGVWTTDPQGRNTYVSPRWTEIAGRTAEEAVGTGWSLGLHPDDRETVFANWELSALKGDPYISEFRFVHSDGKVVWVLCQALPVLGAADEVIEWVGSIVDITEQKQRESQLESRIEDLEVVEQVHNSIHAGENLKTTVALMTRGLENVFHSQGGLTLFKQPDAEYLYVQEMHFVSQVVTRLEKIIGKKATSLPLRIPTVGDGYFAQVMRSGEPVRLTKPEEISAVMAEFTESKLLLRLIPRVIASLQLRSVLLLPLIIAGEQIGVVSLNRTSLFTEAEQQRAMVILNQMVTAVSRQQLADQLAVSKERYRGLVESLESVLVIVNRQRRMSYANDNIEEVFHLKRESLIGEVPSSVFPPVFAEKIMDMIDEVFSTQSSVMFEAPMPLPEGERWFRITLRLLKAVGGDDDNVLIHASDIDSLKKAQQELQALNQTLEQRVEERTAQVQDLYDNAPTGYHSIDENGTIVLMNRTHANWLGYSVEELLGSSILDIITPESREAFHETYPAFIKAGSVRDLPFDFVRKDGSILPVLLGSKALYDQDGNYVMSRTTIFDNTERKKAEEALRESEKTYRALFEATNDAVFLLSLQGEYLTVNQRAAEMLGFDSPEQLSGVDSKDYLAPAEHAQADNVLARLLNDERIFPYERTMVKKDGTRIIAEITPSLVRDETGEPKMIQSVVRDVTRRHEDLLAVQESEDRLKRANLTLERAAQLKDEFLASMSHELRTPLTSILALSEAMQYETFGDVNEKQKKALVNIEESGRHLLDLINDILDLSKLDAGKLDIAFEWYPLHEICQASLTLIKGMANKKQQIVKFSTNVPTAMVYVDPRRLKQVIVNLLSNAVKFTDNGKTIGLEVEAQEEQGRIKLTVWDTGKGIAADDLPRLFQPFVQLDSSLARQHTGTGLGLSLVKRMTELHGGSVHVDSKLGEGSRFTVVLPWNPAGDERTQASSDQQPPDSSLVVEDDPLDAQHLRNYLKALGIDVTVVETGTEVLATAIDQQPGLVLLDLNLPDLHGFSVLQALKEDKRTAQIPVVIASIDDERGRARELGASGYLVKPFSMVELQHEIKGLFPHGGQEPQAMLVEKMEMKPMVLLADDTEVTLDTVSYFLNSKNFHVLKAHDGFEVLALLENHVPDVILMDIQMPGMDGFETIQHIRQNPDPQIAKIPIIALTALAMDGDRDRCLSAGADDYLSKPVRLDTLTEKLFSYLRKRSQKKTTKSEGGG